MKESDRTGSSISVRLPPFEVFRGTLVVLGVLLGAYLLWRVQEVVFLLLFAVLLATAVEPLVNMLRRGPFTRGSGTLVVYSAIVLAIGIPAYLVLPAFMAQAGTFFDGLPQRIESLRPYLNGMPQILRDDGAALLDRASELVRSPAPPEDEQIVAAGATAAHSLFSFITVFVLSFYWLVERSSIKRAIMRLVPAPQARTVNTVWVEVEEKFGGWVRGQLVLMLSMACMAGVGYTVLGLPNPLLLAVAAGLFEIVPLVGPFLSAAPAVLIALTIDPALALIVAIFGLITQQVENNILVPRIMGHTVGVSPLVVLVGILVGAVLWGIPGAFLAVPVAGAIQVILAHVVHMEDEAQEAAHLGSPCVIAPGPAGTAGVGAVPVVPGNGVPAVSGDAVELKQHP